MQLVSRAVRRAAKKLADKQNFSNAPHEESSAMMWLCEGGSKLRIHHAEWVRRLCGAVCQSVFRRALFLLHLLF